MELAGVWAIAGTRIRGRDTISRAEYTESLDDLIEDLSDDYVTKRRVETCNTIADEIKNGQLKAMSILINQEAGKKSGINWRRKTTLHQTLCPTTFNLVFPLSLISLQYHWDSQEKYISWLENIEDDAYTFFSTGGVLLGYTSKPFIMN